MKRVVVVSDSHGNKEGIDKIFKNLKFDYFIFLGDCVADLGLYQNLDNVLAVKGNCDFFSNVKTFGVLEIEEIKLFYTHGHEYNVKKTNQNIIGAGKLLNADVVLYGHTHKYSHEIIDGVHIVNCPAFSYARGGECKFLVLEIENKKISIFQREI